MLFVQCFFFLCVCVLSLPNHRRTALEVIRPGVMVGLAQSQGGGAPNGQFANTTKGPYSEGNNTPPALEFCLGAVVDLKTPPPCVASFR